MPHHLDHIIDAITKLLVGLITALLHRRLAQRPSEPPALPPVSGWMRSNVHALYIFTRNQFASYLLSSGFEQLLPASPGQGFVAGLLAEAATRLLSASWRAWQRHRAKKLLASKAAPALPPAKPRRRRRCSPAYPAPGA